MPAPETDHVMIPVRGLNEPFTVAVHVEPNFRGDAVHDMLVVVECVAVALTAKGAVPVLMLFQWSPE